MGRACTDLMGTGGADIFTIMSLVLFGIILEKVSNMLLLQHNGAQDL